MIELLIIIGILIRLYHMGDLAIFLADQATDSTAVLTMLRGKLTLLGPVTSVGGFYNGPIVYYLMLPFYAAFQGDPIAGTVFQTTLSIATMFLLYLVGKKLENKTVGLLASFLFAISPLMIDYSRQAFNSLPIIFFSTLCIYLYLQLIDKFSITKTALLGLVIGFMLQMHYLTISVVIFALFYPLFFEKKLASAKYYFAVIIGIIVGLSPFLLFELRHQFLNTQLFLRYLTSSAASHRSIVNAFLIWPQLTSNLYMGNNLLLGLMAFCTVFITIAYLYRYKKTQKKYITMFIVYFGIIFMVGLVYGRELQLHYVIAFHTSLILLSSLTLYALFKGKRQYIAIFCILIFLLNMSFWNIDKKTHPLQDGLSIKDFKVAAQIIKNDTKNTYNVGMHAQGDNRAMPLRYTLNLIGETPAYYDNYSGVDSLYFIIKKSEPIMNLKMWEYVSFGPSKVVYRTEINNDYYLYKLVKK